MIAGKLARYLVWALRRRILLPHEPASGIIVYHFAQTFPNPSPAPQRKLESMMPHELKRLAAAPEGRVESINIVDIRRSAAPVGTVSTA